MFKKFIGGFLLAVMLQGSAYASTFASPEKVIVPNKVGEVYSSISSKVTRNPDDYESAEVFANFREIRTTGIKARTVYRSSNPIDIHGNKVRHTYADRLAMVAGIKTEIDLAENENEVKDNFKNSGTRKKYCYGLYKKGKIYSVHLRGDGLESKDWPNIAEAFRFMLDNDGPYLVHCRLGRDRAGIFSMLCSALAGASIEDLRKDYLQTFCNYYHIKPQSYEYEILRKFKADKIIYYIAHPECANDLQGVPDNISLYGIVPEEAAVNFFKVALKFSDKEIKDLQAKLKVEKDNEAML
ncbi:MAG: tyrosine-protein phosphatase [Phascolarctobacterium sp.]|nr:tyrosine-protein phosphatase [Phascolarctobacterium sp.]